MPNCINCGNKVASGGNQHKKGHCPPQGRHGEHHKRRQKRRHAQTDLPVRGVAVGGIIKGGKHKKFAAKK